MPGSDYSQKQFKSDLDELTNLISNYSQEGGKKRSRKSSKKSHKKMSHKRSTKQSGGKRSSKRSTKKSGGKRSIKRSTKKSGGSTKRSASTKRSGGKKRRTSHKKSKKSSKKSSRNGGAKKRERHLDAEGDPIRSFRVININGRDVSGSKNYAIRYYHGTKKNNTPGKAAEHAFSKLCRHTGQKNKNACKVTFTLLETTKGSAHKTWGPYKGKFLKLRESRRITRRDPKTGKKSSYMVYFKPYVVLAEGK